MRNRRNPTSVKDQFPNVRRLTIYLDNGVLLTCWDIVKACAQRMTWKGQHPTVMQLDGDYPFGVIVPKKEMIELNKRLERSETLAKYDILIRPTIPRGR